MGRLSKYNFTARGDYVLVLENGEVIYEVKAGRIEDIIIFTPVYAKGLKPILFIHDVDSEYTLTCETREEAQLLKVKLDMVLNTIRENEDPFQLDLSPDDELLEFIAEFLDRPHVEAHLDSLNGEGGPKEGIRPRLDGESDMEYALYLTTLSPVLADFANVYISNVELIKELFETES